MGAKAAANPNQLYEVMTGLANIEGAANNLRGALYKLTVRNLFKYIKGARVDTGIRRFSYSKCDKLTKFNPKCFELSIHPSC